MDADKTRSVGVPEGRKIASAQEIKVTTSAESTVGLEIMAWLEVHKQKLVIAGAVVLAAAVIGVIYNHWSSGRELEANEALLMLRTPVTGPDRGKAAPSEKILQVVTEYSGTEAAKRALLLAAEAQFNENKYDQAKASFEQFLRENPGSPLSAQADLGIAACLDAANKPKEALAAYDLVRKRYAQEGGVVAQTRLAMGRLYEGQSKFDEAYKLYREMTQSGYNSWAEEAFMRLMQLEKAHPELAALRNPPPQPQPQMPIIMTNRPPPLPSATNVTVKPAAKPGPGPGPAPTPGTNLATKPAGK
jgi:predicted negative regulator of RcsB-dependent stress response